MLKTYLTKLKATFLTAVAAMAVMPASAADFFSTEQPESLFDIGLRAGVNTSNRNIHKNTFDIWNRNSWGTGFNIGAVVNLNFRDYISIQPGIFFDSRSGSWAYASSEGTDLNAGALTQFGKGRTYNINIPVLCAIHFNVTDNLRWNIEAGPYLQVKLKNDINGKFSYPARVSDHDTEYATASLRTCDFGFKFGSSLDILYHYNVGIHYLAGCLDVWNPSFLGGRNKEWSFTIGYNF